MTFGHKDYSYVCPSCERRQHVQLSFVEEQEQKIDVSRWCSECGATHRFVYSIFRDRLKVEQFLCNEEKRVVRLKEK